jgi:mono/diheme cytochrome c family protein
MNMDQPDPSPTAANDSPGHRRSPAPVGESRPTVDLSRHGGAGRAPRERGGWGARLRRAGLWAAGGLGLLVATGTIAVLVRENRTFTAPAVDLHASSDPAVIARGRYLVSGPGHCAECHGAPEQQAARAAGHEIPLSGGVEFVLPVGTFRVPNLTSDPDTGLGRLADGDLARVLRYGVRPDGRGMLPFMPFANLADDDLTAIISYLRSLPPVHHAVQPHHVNVLGRIVKAFVIAPKGPKGPVLASMPPAETPEYGRYLAHNVANCVGCHTRVDMRTGEPVGPAFGGGMVIESMTATGNKFVTPNLTPEPRWGWIASWPEEVFVARFKQGLLRAGSPMPWNAFRNMSDGDLRALYRYLRTVKAVEGGPDPSRNDSVVALGST